MPADIDLRDEVLKGIDREIEQNRARATHDRNRMAVWTTYRIALRHLREIVEMHVHTNYDNSPYGVARSCRVCGSPNNADMSYWCPTLLSLAPDYAPDALAVMEVKK